MRSVVTEKDLNREFFTSADAADDKTSSHQRRHLISSFINNCRFCCVFLIPKLGHALSRKCRSFSLSGLLRRTFPGMILLGVWLQVLGDLFKKPLVRRRRRRGRLGDVDGGGIVSAAEVTVAVPLDDESSSSSDDGARRLRPSESENNNEEEMEQGRLQSLAGNPLPVEESFPTKKIVKESWVGDLFTGLSVGAMSIPMGMSYALLAGLSYQYGLYNNFIYPFTYMMFGTCRQAVLGVSAMENIILGTTIDGLMGGGVGGADEGGASAADRHNCGVALCIMCGIVYMVFRVLKLAVLADLLAEPVLSGFATASAFLVGTSQLKHVFDLSAIKSDWSLVRSWSYILTHIEEFNWYAILISTLSLLFLFVCKRLSKKCNRFSIPGPLLLVAITCVLSWAIDLEGNLNIKIVGYIPQGLPSLTFPNLSWTPEAATTSSPYIGSVFISALLLCPIYFVIHMSIAKTIATRQNYGLDIAQELVAFSLSNFIGGVLSGFPGATSLSRSSVTETLGAQTQLHGIAAGLIVICTVLFLTIPLGFLPMPALAAVVLFGVIKMAEFDKLAKLWRLQKVAWLEASAATATIPDLLLWITSFLGTMLISAQFGILLSVAISLIFVGKAIVRPPYIQLARIPNTEIYRNIDRFPESITEQGIVIYRVDASINFCNANFLEQQTKLAIVKHFGFKNAQPIPSHPAVHIPTSDTLVAPQLQDDDEEDLENVSPTVRRHKRSPKCKLSRPSSPQKKQDIAKPSAKTPTTTLLPPPYFFVLDCSSVNGLDVTAISALRRIAEFATMYRCVLLFANWKGPQRDYLQHADFYSIVPPQRCFLSNHDAVTWAKVARSRCLNVRTDSPRPALLSTTVTGGDSAEIANTWRRRTAVDNNNPLMITTTSQHSVQVEWDGLSALVPNMRVVREIASDGSREWPVAVAETVTEPPAILAGREEGFNSPNSVAGES